MPRYSIHKKGGDASERNETKNKMCTVADKQIKKAKSKNLKELKMLKKTVSMALMALFVFSFITVAAVSADETQKIKGTVMSINVETGEVIVKDDAGEMKSLMADPKAGVDLKMLKEGDPVSVESDSNGVIKSLDISK
jgi:hypothetical protein